MCVTLDAWPSPGILFPSKQLTFKPTWWSSVWHTLPTLHYNWFKWCQLQETRDWRMCHRLTQISTHSCISVSVSISTLPLAVKIERHHALLMWQTSICRMTCRCSPDHFLKRSSYHPICLSASNCCAGKRCCVTGSRLLNVTSDGLMCYQWLSEANSSWDPKRWTDE